VPQLAIIWRASAVDRPSAVGEPIKRLLVDLVGAKIRVNAGQELANPRAGAHGGRRRLGLELAELLEKLGSDALVIGWSVGSSTGGQRLSAASASLSWRLGAALAVGPVRHGSLRDEVALRVDRRQQP
jgi:hypothetical protein